MSIEAATTFDMDLRLKLALELDIFESACEL